MPPDVAEPTSGSVRPNDPIFSQRIIGGSPRCTGRSQALSGDFAEEAALTRLLADTNCDFRRVAPDVFRIVMRTEPDRRPDAFPTQPTAATVTQVIVSATKRRAVVDQLPDALTDEAELAEAERHLRASG